MYFFLFVSACIFGGKFDSDSDASSGGGSNGSSPVDTGVEVVGNGSDTGSDSGIDSGGSDSVPEIVDADGDGYTIDGGDCNDADPAINPAAIEFCDEIDNDCDGQVDEGYQKTWYLDSDGDGYGEEGGVPLETCDPPSGYVTNDGDCSDWNPDKYPGATEYCDEIDNDCDESIDEDAVDMSTWYFDPDHDGYGSDLWGMLISCSGGPDYVLINGDCWEGDSLSYPGAVERCDAMDNDCDGEMDEDAVDKQTWYVDADNDGYGDSADAGTIACAMPGYVTNAQDCNDWDSGINSDMPERCGGPDDDCDGEESEYCVEGSDYACDEDIEQEACSSWSP